MIIYLDIVFIENILMNYVILLVTTIIQKEKIKYFRLIIASLIGGIYTIFFYLNIIPEYLNFIMKILISIIMVYIVFRYKNINTFIKRILLFYLCSFTLSGCTLGIVYILKPINSNIKLNNYAFLILLLSAILGGMLIYFCFKKNIRYIKNKDMCCKILICINNKTKWVNSYIDSGNTLKTKYNKESVIVVEKNKISDLIDNNLDSIMGGENVNKLRIIPYNSIGNENGILIGIKSDYVKVKHNNTENIKKNVIVGLYEKKISKQYQALIGLDLLEGD